MKNLLSDDILHIICFKITEKNSTLFFFFKKVQKHNTDTHGKKWNMHAWGFAARHSIGQCFKKGIDLERRNFICSSLMPVGCLSSILETNK